MCLADRVAAHARIAECTSQQDAQRSRDRVHGGEAVIEAESGLHRRGRSLRHHRFIVLAIGEPPRPGAGRTELGLDRREGQHRKIDDPSQPQQP